MDFIKKILVNGVFNTMIDESINPKIRKFILAIVTFLYLLLIVGFVMLIPVYEIYSWRRIMSAFAIGFTVLLLWQYVRLGIHVSRIRRRKKKEAIKRQEKLKQEIEEEEKDNPDHIYKT